MQNPLIVQRIIFIFAAVLAFTLIALVPISYKYTLGDFDVYYNTGHHYLAKAPLYVPHQSIDEFKYSPFFALCFSPLTFWDEKTAFCLWTIINVLFFYGIFYLLYKLKQFSVTGVRDLLIILCLFALTGRFIFECFRIGQVNFILCFFMVLTMYFEINRKYYLASVALAICLMIKLFPLLFVLYYLIKRRFELIGYTFLMVTLLLFLPSIYSGWGLNLKYLHDWVLLLRSDPPTILYSVKNNSLLSFFSWFFIARHEMCDVLNYEIIKKLLSPAVYYSWGISCLIFFMAFFYDSFSVKERDPKISYLEYSCLFVCVLLFNPLAYLNALIFLIIPYFFILRFLFYSQLTLRYSWLCGSIIVFNFFLTLSDNKVFFHNIDDFYTFFALRPLMWVMIILYISLFAAKSSILSNLFDP